ncbi:MAG: hypothetical protein Alpg2KO_30720 [Alphaproteobacteria bacterium]
MKSNRISTKSPVGHKRGISASSYGLLVGLVGVVALAAISSSGQSVNDLFTEVSDSLGTVNGAEVASNQEAPDSFTFTDEPAAAASTQIMSDIVQISGHSGVTVGVSGGNAEYRICSDMSCSSVGHDWGNSGNQIENGEYLQLRVTSDATESNSVVVTATAGSGSATWTVTTSDAPPVETQNWSTANPGDGTGGVTSVRWVESSNPDPTTFRMTWPIVTLSGTNISNGTYTLHAGCGNVNGQDSCNAVCVSLGFSGLKSGWDNNCGNGYPNGAESIASTCVYKHGNTNGIDTGTQDWQANYGATTSCNNPMEYCDCAVP